MKTYYFLAIMASVNFFASTEAKAQYSDMEIGFKLSGFAYQGDITHSAIGTLKKPKPGFGIFLHKIVSSPLSLRINADYTQLQAKDVDYASHWWRNQRNFGFKTNLLDVSANVIYSFKDNYNEEYSFRPYIFAGVGASFIKVRRDYSKFNEAFYVVGEQWVIDGLKKDAATTPPPVTLNIPVGAGFKYSFNNSWALIAEGNYRFLFTDYFDGFSKAVHPKNDHYYSGSVGLAFTISQGDE